MSDYSKATNELLKGIRFMIQDLFNRNSTRVYNCLAISESTNGKWNVKYNGETHAVEPYKITPVAGEIYKVVIPNGNPNLAYFY